MRPCGLCRGAIRSRGAGQPGKAANGVSEIGMIALFCSPFFDFSLKLHSHPNTSERCNAGRRLQTSQEFSCESVVVRLTSCQGEPDRQAIGIDYPYRQSATANKIAQDGRHRMDTQVTIPTPPLEAVAVIYLSSSLLAVTIDRFCSVPFPHCFLAPSPALAL